jgi:sulfide:quinone oxidoreductase
MNDSRFSVLIAGGGVAALEAALTLQELAGERARVELLAPEPRFWYRPVAVAEPFGLGAVRHFDLGLVAARAGAELMLGALAGVDVDRHVAQTKDGAARPYDALLIACGAEPTTAVPGALTFRGPADSERLRTLLRELENGEASHVAFAVPWGAAWPLPAYELALMTARRLERAGGRVEVSVVTPEAEPLHLFGRVASDAVRELLREQGVEFVGGVYPLEASEGRLVFSGGEVAADRVVALPRLRGAPIDGIAQTAEGFLPVDDHCGVLGADDVFAAGDITSFPVKQGGIAAQQADAAAEAIAVLAGATLVPCPFRPVLRGMLLTGADPAYLRRDLSQGGESEWTREAAIWWPPTKIVGRRLTSFLASLAGEDSDEGSPPGGHVEVEVPLDRAEVDRLTAAVPDAFSAGPPGAPSRRVESVMHEDVLLVGPDTTLEGVARLMRKHDRGCVLVVENERLVGIATARDVLRAVSGGVVAADAAVRSWMTAEPIVAELRTPVDVARETMAEHGIHHLPVVEDGRVLGLVGLRDVTPSRRGAARLPIGLGF